MKNKFLALIVMLFLSTNYLYSQEPISKGSFKIGAVVFEVEETNDLNRFFIRNSKDTLIREDNPDFLFVDRNLSNTDELKLLVLQTLKKKKTDLKLNNVNLKIFCSFFPNGKIHSLSYVINSATALNLQDIACIDQHLRENFIAQIRSSHDLHLELKSIPFTVELNFD